MPNIFLKNEHCEAGGTPSLQSVLENWIKTNREYLHQWDADDPPWDYGERSCTGFLATAVWRSGGIALEEWLTKKGPSGTRNGRGDLWIFLHKEQQQYQAFVEAKYMCFNWNKGVNDVEQHLKAATTDAGDHVVSEAKIGVLFIVLPYPYGAQNEARERMATWLKGIYELQLSAIAWIVSDGWELRPGVSPGLVLVARTYECQPPLVPTGVLEPTAAP